MLERLHAIQDLHGQIRHSDLATLCGEMRIPLAEGYEVATFYHRLDVVPDEAAPAERDPIRVCDGLPCLMRGAREIGADVERRMGRAVRWGPCIGRCDAAPAVEVGRRVVAPATADRVAEAAGPDRGAEGDGTATLDAGGFQIGRASCRERVYVLV